ncbi:uncharacterized protein EV422DRAFT_530144 [Fimicolochytrium jonesii]|uniref:uncharacterized protein n=1 Tax=Fimicolochytrium jonesii TaxID=1396493 RepID=UPI0022FF365C|nr:uncharacterized protein EV422DRAFT_530144 [Fimicolochytrium jonesii]KAI8820782.1 hypothetical protein EV422DRAFT_530144 [Fimicolochytrium jonesii]
MAEDSYHELLGLPPLRVRETVELNIPLPPSQMVQDDAALRIQRGWKAYVDRRTFGWLKENLLRAERSMTMEILRRLAPKEAELMRDPVFEARIRFRFGGTSFPPTIMYKIYTKSNSVHYYSGNRVIQSHTQAAVDSCTIMGVRLYAENLIRTEQQNRALKMPHSDQVTNRLEFIQHMSSLDQKPAYMGGRNNGWREMNVTPYAGLSECVFDVRRRGGVPERRALPWKRRPQKPGNCGKGRNEPRFGKAGDDRQMYKHEDDLWEDDDFDPLFAWTNNLNLESLVDYVLEE